MSVVAEMAPRPLEPMSNAEMNATASSSSTHGGISSSHPSAASSSSSSSKRKASDDGAEAFEEHARKENKNSRVSRVPESPQRDASRQDKAKVLSPEKEIALAEKEERRKQKDAKKEERLKKEAEKEAKRHKEAQLRKKSANFMFSFVQQRSTVSSPQKQVRPVSQLSDYERTFPPCNYKDLAPINRFRKTLDHQFDEAIDGRCAQQGQVLLQEMLGRHRPVQSPTAMAKRRSRKGIRAPISVRDSMRLITEAGVLGDDRLEERGRRGLANLADRVRVPMKLLHFESDRRPAWYGTWTRSSNLVGLRRPLGQDPVALDYSYDSDAEWEDVDQFDGDDVQDNDDRDDEDRCSRSDSGSEMDDWLVDDLEVEEEDDVDGDHPALHMNAFNSVHAPLPSDKGFEGANALSEKAKRKKKIKSIGRRFEAKLIKFETGPHWEEVLGEPVYEGFGGYQMEMLNDAYLGLNPFTFSTTDSTQVGSSHSGVTGLETAIGQEKQANQDPAGIACQALSTPKGKEPLVSRSPASAVLLKAKAFPEGHLIELLRAIEGKPTIRPILVEELRGLFASLGKTGVPKTTLEACLTVYAEKQSKKAGGKWVIRDEFRPFAGL